MSKQSQFRLCGKLTTRFIAFYVLLVLLPIVALVVIYSGNLATEWQRKQVLEKQLVLDQSARFFSDYLAQADTVYGTMQSSGALIDMLENNYLTASDELSAYVSQIRPLFLSLLTANPVVEDISIYRDRTSFIGNAGLVYNLAMRDEFPYDPALLDELSLQNKAGVLFADPSLARHRPDQPAQSSIYCCLYNLYAKSYGHVVGVLEVQINLNRALNSMRFSQPNGKLYLSYEGLWYPIDHRGTAQLHWQTALSSLPERENSDFEITAAAAPPFSFIYRFDMRGLQYPSLFPEVLAIGLTLLVTTGLYCAFVYRYAFRLARFSAHLSQSGNGGLSKFALYAGDDEFGEVVRAYNDMTDTIGRLIESVRDAEKLKNDATYYAMSSQVNPHFMFNTLESIRMYIEINDTEAASRMLFVLGRFLRYSISLRRESKLFDELEHIRNYLLIYQYRGSDRIRFEIKRDDIAPNVPCPFCVLQPIVENCLKHGIRDLSGRISIVVSVFSREDGVVVEVADDGVGMTDEELEAVSERLRHPEGYEPPAENRVGLFNVNARLMYYYGGASGLSLRRNEPTGLVCSLRLLEK